MQKRLQLKTCCSTAVEFSPVIVVPNNKLKIFEGIYSSNNLPIQLKIFVENDVLFGQGTG
jgi:hypothetical protein